LRLVEAPEVQPGRAKLFPFSAALVIAGITMSGVAVAGTMIWIRMAAVLPAEPTTVVVIDSPALLEEPKEEPKEESVEVRHELEALPPAPAVMAAITVDATLEGDVPAPSVELNEEPFEVSEVWEDAAKPFPVPEPPKPVVKPKVAQKKSAPRSFPKPKSERRAPRVARQVPPTYPAAARRAGVEGSVLLQVAVLINGRAGNVSLVSSSGSGLLDAAAMRAVRKWSFRPATLDGKPTSGEVRVPVRFQLQ
jgi:protein TonB